MEQEKYWKKKWDELERYPPSSFAKRSITIIKERNLKTLLDIGCGDGSDSVYFANKGLKVTAVDFSESGIRRLKELISENKIGNIMPVMKDIREIDFDDNSFGVVYAHLSLQYFDDKTTTMLFNKIHRILKKGGLFLVKCRSTDDGFFGQGEKVGENMFIRGQLRHFFDKKYMEEKLQRFIILRIRKTKSVYRQRKSSFIEAIATK